MKAKERIAELERRVAELEARAPVIYQPWSPVYGRCVWCGGALTADHYCARWWVAPITVGDASTTVWNQINGILEGATA